MWEALCQANAERDAARAEVARMKADLHAERLEWDALNQRYKDATAERDALAQDAVRLDWLDAQKGRVYADNGSNWDSWEITLDPPQDINIRQAIDAALSTTTEGRNDE
jgi:hypothetical protein